MSQILLNWSIQFLRKPVKQRKDLSSPGPELFIWLVKEEPSGIRVAKT